MNLRVHNVMTHATDLVPLGLEPPAWVIVTQEYPLIHILQPIVPLPSVPTGIFTLEDIP